MPSLFVHNNNKTLAVAATHKRPALAFLANHPCLLAVCPRAKSHPYELSLNRFDDSPQNTFKMKTGIFSVAALSLLTLAAAQPHGSLASE